MIVAQRQFTTVHGLGRAFAKAIGILVFGAAILNAQPETQLRFFCERKIVLSKRSNAGRLILTVEAYIQAVSKVVERIVVLTAVKRIQIILQLHGVDTHKPALANKTKFLASVFLLRSLIEI